MKKQSDQSFPNRDLAIGVGVGLALGAALGNLALGLAIGIVIGGLATIWKKKRASDL